MAKRISDLLRRGEAEKPYIPRFNGKVRAQIAALGDVGQTALLGLLLLGGDLFSEIGIYDINEANLARLEMECGQMRFPSGDKNIPPVRVLREEDLFDCDVFLFCASKGVPAIGASGDVRMAQYEANKGIVSLYAKMAKNRDYRGLICVVSDPVDPLAGVFLRESGLSPEQIRGYGLGVMNARACYYAERNEKYSRYLEEGRVYGPHGQDLVVADSVVNYNDDLSLELTDLVTSANLRVRDLGYKPYLAPAISSCAISVIATLTGQWHYSSIWIGDSDSGAFLGIRNRFGSGGSEYEDIPLDDRLFERIQAAYDALRKLYEALD